MTDRPSSNLVTLNTFSFYFGLRSFCRLTAQLLQGEGVGEIYFTYLLGILRGGLKSFKFINRMRLKAKSASARRLYLRTLTYTKNPKLLTKLVQQAEAKLSNRLFQYVCYNRRGRHKAIEGLKRVWLKMVEKNKRSTGTMKFMISACFGAGTTNADLVEAKHFMETQKVGRFKLYFQRAIERVEQYIDFAARYKKDVESWFTKYSGVCSNAGFNDVGGLISDPGVIETE